MPLLVRLQLPSTQHHAFITHLHHLTAHFLKNSVYIFFAETHRASHHNFQSAEQLRKFINATTSTIENTDHDFHATSSTALHNHTYRYVCKQARTRNHTNGNLADPVTPRVAAGKRNAHDSRPSQIHRQKIMMILALSIHLRHPTTSTFSRSTTSQGREPTRTHGTGTDVCVDYQ